MTATRDRARTRAGVALPLVMTVLVGVLDVLEGPHPEYVGLLTAPPLVAAALVGPVGTLVVGAAALLGGFVVGLLQQDATGAVAAWTTPQVVRLSFIAAAVLLAVAVARARAVGARRLLRVQSVADVAQRAILDPPPALVGGVRCAVRYHSAAREARIGGDLVEVLDTPYGVRILVGDCRGSGLPAVRLAGQVLGSFREVAWSQGSLAEVATSLDRAVRRAATQEVSEDFVTALLLQLDADGVSVVSCGHPPPYLLPPEGQVRAEPVHRTLLQRLTRARRTREVVDVSTPSVEAEPPLGLLHGAPAVHRLQVGGGDRIVLATDGLLEARRSGRFIDVPAVLGQAFVRRGPDEALDHVVEQVRHWVRGSLDDDLAVAVIEVPA